MKQLARLPTCSETTVEYPIYFCAEEQFNVLVQELNSRTLLTDVESIFRRIRFTRNMRYFITTAGRVITGLKSERIFYVKLELQEVSSHGVETRKKP